MAILFEYVLEGEDREPGLQETSHLALHSSLLQKMDNGDAVVHPSGDVAVVATYVGKLKVLVLENLQRTTIKSEFDCK